VTCGDFNDFRPVLQEKFNTPFYLLCSSRDLSTTGHGYLAFSGRPPCMIDGWTGEFLPDTPSTSASPNSRALCFLTENSWKIQAVSASLREELTTADIYFRHTSC
jgi:hypothetical protein